MDVDREGERGSNFNLNSLGPPTSTPSLASKKLDSSSASGRPAGFTSAQLASSSLGAYWSLSSSVSRGNGSSSASNSGIASPAAATSTVSAAAAAVGDKCGLGGGSTSAYDNCSVGPGCGNRAMQLRLSPQLELRPVSFTLTPTRTAVIMQQ